ncbi:hypothetical protein PMAYCL1PPCAC_08663 [Pristionchus mayeri]|uniref:Peroxidase n=1 Tax=Pristionchus mayeri TaxID=1317129 RepID=A0AAN4ZC64_9BILA|nr:hypothetical protein PMAYCL1PPCAC_08663 [Pristionchus mayeri]
MLGSAMHPIRRFMGAPKYDDGFNSVRRRSANGGVLPSTRAISNKIFAEASIPPFDPKYNHFLMQFGQWIAHDIISTPLATGPTGALLDCTKCESEEITANCAPIEVPEDDSFFPAKTVDGKKACIRLTRAINGQQGLGPRQQINQNSHFLDLSQVYGSTDCVAKSLRTLQDGMMKVHTAQGYTLPPQATNSSNCQSAPTYPCFSAGDARSSLHPGLIPMHTLYLRQHNKWAGQIKVLNPLWNDEKIYQETRRLMIALYQSHIYSEYLSKIIGQQKMQQFALNPSGRSNTYDPRINPSVSVEFCSGAFRFGQSQARKDVPRRTNQNVSIGATIDLGQHIFYTDPIYDKTATVSSMMQGMVNCPGMAVDRQFSFPMRNEMFSKRGQKASGVDLPAFNVQRGREKGIQPYNEVRVSLPSMHSRRIWIRQPLI